MILEVFSLLHRDALATSFKRLENHDDFNAGLEKGTCDSLCIASASKLIISLLLFQSFPLFRGTIFSDITLTARGLTLI
jgi:hypothetical protein